MGATIYLSKDVLHFIDYQSFPSITTPPFLTALSQHESKKVTPHTGIKERMPGHWPLQAITKSHTGHSLNWAAHQQWFLILAIALQRWAWKLLVTPYETPDATSYLEMILGLGGPLSKEVLSCVPLAKPPDQKYNSLGVPSITLRGHIAFNSYWENLLAAFPAFTLSSLCLYHTTFKELCQHLFQLLSVVFLHQLNILNITDL